MLNFSEFFPQKGSRAQKGSRSRIIGQFGCSKLLYLVNNSKETSVELVSPDGESITALQFNEYIDIINADLSSDFEILHITRRITSQKGFAFLSIFYHIHSPAKSREFVSEKPITSFFLPDCSSPDYYLLHIVDHKISHIHIQLTKSNIAVEVMRGGVNIPAVVSFTYHRSTAKLMVIHEIKNNPHFSEFNLNNIKVATNIPMPVFIHPLSKLPPELALSPLSPMHLPYFRTMCNRIFCTKYGSNICVIQQLFENVDLFMQFSVNMYPRHFSTIITVPNVHCDLPLCYQQFGSVLFLFVVNQFVCVIDIAQNPPFITMQMNPFSSGVLSDCSASLPLSHHLIDLNSGDVFQVSVPLTNYKMFAPVMDRNKWDMMALLCARIQDSKLISSVIKLLYTCADPINVVYVIRKIFHYLQCDLIATPDVKKKLTRQLSTGARYPDRLLPLSPTRSVAMISPPPSAVLPQTHISLQQQNMFTSQGSYKTQMRSKSIRSIHRRDLSESIRMRLSEIEEEFPSSSFVPRRKTYRKLLNQMLSESRSHKKIEEAANKAIARLESQNNASLIFRSSLDTWKNEDSPDEFWQFIIFFSFLSETILNDFPSIMVLRNETENLFDEIGPDPMFRAFRAHHVFNATSARRNKAEEVNYWKERVLNEDDSSSSDSDNEDSGSSPDTTAKKSSSSDKSQQYVASNEQ